MHVATQEGTLFPHYRCDNGAEFINRGVAELVLLLGGQQRRGAPYHPQSQGQVERFNLTVRQDMADKHLQREILKSEHEIRKSFEQMYEKISGDGKIGSGGSYVLVNSPIGNMTGKTKQSYESDPDDDNAVLQFRDSIINIARPRGEGTTHGWQVALANLVYRHNTTVHRTLGHRTPFELNKGRPNQIFQFHSSFGDQAMDQLRMQEGILHAQIELAKANVRLGARGAPGPVEPNRLEPGSLAYVARTEGPGRRRPGSSKAIDKKPLNMVYLVERVKGERARWRYVPVFDSRVLSCDLLRLAPQSISDGRLMVANTRAESMLSLMKETGPVGSEGDEHRSRLLTFFERLAKSKDEVLKSFRDELLEEEVQAAASDVSNNELEGAWPITELIGRRFPMCSC